MDVADRELLHDVVARHLAGQAQRGSGLGFYYELERCSSLLEFHTMLRGGPRNRTHDGLQQSYGDHNRLLMHALDRLLAGDLEWLRSRVTAGTSIDEESLRSCAITASELTLTPEEELALWFGAALHDCGMLCSRQTHVDVEDGVVLAGPLLDEYCPAATRSVAEFTLHHHDYVKDAFLGEAPVRAIADDLAALDPELRTLAMVALGLVQVAGASSLGEGRLDDVRLEIFHACVTGDAFVDLSRELRLARLLMRAPAEHHPGPTVPDIATASALAPHVREELGGLLDDVFLHGWHDCTRHAPPEVRVELLCRLAGCNREWGADHLVIASELRADGTGQLPAVLTTKRRVALSTSTVVTVLS